MRSDEERRKLCLSDLRQLDIMRETKAISVVIVAFQKEADPQKMRGIFIRWAIAHRNHHQRVAIEV